MAVVGVLAVLSGCQGFRASSPAPPSGTTGARVWQAMDAAYAAGFRTEGNLLAVTSIAVAESSLQPEARNWHPEYGYRPSGDVIGVTGGPDVWSTDGRQLHSDRGLWQISSHSWHQFTDAQCDDPSRAARVAFTISDGGTNFSLWDTYASGSAQRHYDRSDDGWPALRPLVRSFLSQVL